MRSLFWRIFLWFWLAALVLAGAVAATVYITDPDQFFPRGRYVPIHLVEELGAASVQLYEKDGAAALREYLTKLPDGEQAHAQPTQGHFEKVYLFEMPSRRELAGQRPLADLPELLARAEGSPDPQLERHLSHLFLAKAIDGSDAGGHRRYVFVMSLPRSSILLPTTPQGVLEVAAALITSTLVCYWLARYVVLPVRQLQAATRRLADGDLSARVASEPALVGRRDEFSELARDFDEMAARIEALVTAQKRLIADISHELGSPLTRVSVALGLARRKGNEAVQPELNRIGLEAERLNELIRQLLLISELESRDKLEPPEPIDLRALAEEIAADAEFEASSRRCSVRLETDGPMRMIGVRHLLRSAVENVVRNAIRYTAEDSEVLIELLRQPGSGSGTNGCRAVVRVRDHGPGVPASALTNLFQPFYRVSEARDRLSGGTGLGLAITQKAVEAHGGSVRAANQPEGGLLVEIQLPL